jgi:hypothetical protein
MYADRLKGSGPGAMGFASAVDCSTIHLASWFGSRGRLPLPMVIHPSFHNPDAKARLWKLKLTHYPGLRIRQEPGDGQGGTWITPTMAVNCGLAKVIHVL